MSEISSRKQQLEAFDRLLTIMDELREQCPWDRKQTIDSLRHLTIEETFELSDAILDNDLEEIKKELGDILLHIVFYAKIGSEKGAFDMSTVIDGLCEKLIRRHPHIYSDTQADDEEAVKQNWEKIKLTEKGNTSVLGGVPRSLPALIKAMRIQEKARGVGFDWDDQAQVWEKVEEEMGEFKAEMDQSGEQQKEKASGEFGDLLFSLINYARFVDINPEEALEKTNRKFIHRFQYLEEAARKAGKDLANMSLAEMDIFWNEAKSH
ncbi:nucleoside triphosphate pyrophosphohydrolase [Echinicola pacifica]|uniref:Nucleoside triphosphate pyrophosphohydrolase n=1 Tax=Echinicola pacifica TaxID=346377 RepID=A0A918PR24_9BACT|nr:nucleoside triphosphate pyrophosphohydrolase [Echinicola pacifica]GGZ20045.1 nucleoside triphosphate pyrophosphohydrolase [Echinicola pacifica]